MKPEVFESVTSWRVKRLSLGRASIGFVPTMGALHEGHLQLVDRARKENEFVVVSIFVNPTQFNNPEDLKTYPRNISRDIELLSTRGADFVFLPNAEEIYADRYRFKLTENEDSKGLCGAFRPGHFDGVLIIVLKLLNIISPKTCYMGEKDYQQFQLVKDMAAALFLDTEIVVHSTVREATGLAMSSRNERLTERGRIHAAKIHQTLSQANTGAEAREALEKSGFQVEYLEEKWGRRLTAVWLENVRLIDNVTI